MWFGGLVGMLGTNMIFVFVTRGSMRVGWECLRNTNFVKLLNIISLIFKTQCDVFLGCFHVNLTHTGLECCGVPIGPTPHNTTI